MPTGTLVIPDPANVRAGVQYGADGTEYVGTMDPGTGVYPTKDQIAAAVRDVVVLNVAPSAQLVDPAGNRVTALTLGNLLALTAVTDAGDRTGLGTREIIAAMAGVTGYKLTAARVSETQITMTVTVPGA